MQRDLRTQYASRAEASYSRVSSYTQEEDLRRHLSANENAYKQHDDLIRIETANFLPKTTQVSSRNKSKLCT